MPVAGIDNEKLENFKNESPEKFKEWRDREPMGKKGLSMTFHTAKVSFLRGEHLVNLYNYLHNPNYRLVWDRSKGYSPEFAKKHDEILRKIIENPDRIVKIVLGFDDICNCGVCPKKKKECESEELLKKDRTIASKFGITPGKEYKSRDLIALLSEKESE